MEDNKKITLGEYLEEKCISKIKFAKKVGVTHATLMKYIRGETKPSIDIADAIQKATDGKIKLTDWVK